MASKKSPKAATVAPETLVTPEVGEENTTTTMEPVQLTINDLQLLARIVDLASRRGAFQAGELSQVGESYNKLSSFLAYVESVQKKDETDVSAEAPAETTAE
jgi:hypothetical protein